MKKVFRVFAIAALAFCMTTAVSCGKEEENGPDVLLEEVNFDNGIPSDWTIIDADGDGQTWIDAMGRFNGSIPSWIEFGNNCAVSASFINNIGVLTPDNYLVLPQMHIGKDHQLSYQICSTDDNDFAEHYAVYVGKLDNGTFTPIGTVTEETLTTKSIQSRIFSLNEWSGKDVCIAFRHFNCTNMYWFCLDNVKVAR